MRSGPPAPGRSRSASWASHAARPRHGPGGGEDGFFAVTAACLLAASRGAVPFLLAGTFGSPIDAFFESMSGFTGCGATLLADVDAEPEAILLWRSLMHFLGGAGIYLTVLAFGRCSWLGLDLVTAFAATSSSLNLWGAGIGEVGASENFGAVPPAGRIVLSLLMLVGRLEVFTVVALLTPAFWRRNWA